MLHPIPFKMKFGGKQNGLMNRIRSRPISLLVKKLTYQTNCGKANLPPRVMENGSGLHLMAFLAQVFRQTVPVLTSRSFCTGTALRYDAF